MSLLDIHQIMQYLPHRYPFLLVDRVLEIVDNTRVVAIKNVSINEPFFPGHFPAHPVMPGVLILEAMAQAAALLSFHSAGAVLEEGAIVYFAGIDNARFKRPVVPGDQLVLEATVTRNMRNIWKYQATAKVDGELAAEAELMCAIKTKGA